MHAMESVREAQQTLMKILNDVIAARKTLYAKLCAVRASGVHCDALGDACVRDDRSVAGPTCARADS